MKGLGLSVGARKKLLAAQVCVCLWRRRALRVFVLAVPLVLLAALLFMPAVSPLMSFCVCLHCILVAVCSM
eukprot:3850948-Rhodomonas_salina.1